MARCEWLTQITLNHSHSSTRAAGRIPPRVKDMFVEKLWGVFLCCLTRRGRLFVSHGGQRVRRHPMMCRPRR